MTPPGPLRPTEAGPASNFTPTAPPSLGAHTIMTYVDPSLEPNTPKIVTDSASLRLALYAGLVAAEILGWPGVLSAAVMRAPEAPAVYVRAQTLDVARALADLHELPWHTQATGHGAGALFVHAFEGVHEGIIPVSVYALGERDPDPEVAVLDGPCSLALILAGTLL